MILPGNTMVTLNIKNEEVVRLVKELAEREGKSMTAAVREAVEDRLARDGKARVDEERIQYWLRRGADRRAHATPEWLATNVDDLLYDVDGPSK